MDRDPCNPEETTIEVRVLITRDQLSDRRNALTQVSGSPARVLIEREFESSREPVSWTAWQVSHSEGWLQKLRGVVDHERFLEA